MDKEVSIRNTESMPDKQNINVQEGTQQIKCKVLELRRLLSYICAASGKIPKIHKLYFHKKLALQI